MINHMLERHSEWKGLFFVQGVADCNNVDTGTTSPHTTTPSQSTVLFLSQHTTPLTTRSRYPQNSPPFSFLSFCCPPDSRSGYASWSGGNLEGVSKHPIANMNDPNQNATRVVYAPHAFGPSIYQQVNTHSTTPLTGELEGHASIHSCKSCNPRLIERRLCMCRGSDLT